MSTAGSLHAPAALLPDGWANDVELRWNADGVLTAVERGVTAPAAAPRAAGPLLPGLPNLHSHAFQRAFAGLTEHRGSAEADSFWTWRDRMYRFALAVSPDQLEAIATQLYIEMLAAGYTAVCEFHYLHHDRAGQPYDEPAEMALRLASAARRAGIGLTMLPVLYQDSGFGGKPPRIEQRRFVSRVELLLEIVERCIADGVRTGAAPHSLRAVSPAVLDDLLQGLDAIAPGAPLHIHVAEQQDEVDACLAWSGARPVQWLLDNVALDARWCLVHATHLDAAEARRAVASGAVAGLCPTTEANLGDGIFDAPAFIGPGGRWGIGSDSHASVDAAEELRLLEYSQRLALRRRNVLAGARQSDTAAQLWLSAADGGARASGRPIGALAVGRAADFVVLDAGGARADLAPAQLLGASVFANHGRPAVRDVWVGGMQRITEGRHALGDAAVQPFVDARRALLAAV